jgi:hypothetical protein
MSNNNDKKIGIKNKKEYRLSVGLRKTQQAELKRFVDLDLFTTGADALRDIVERGIEDFRTEKGLQPLDYTHINELRECEV